MSQSIEEEKQVPARDASAPTAVGSESQICIKRTHEHIDDYKQLKLIQAVNMGLSIGCASNLVCIDNPTARLIIKKFKQSNQEQQDTQDTHAGPEENSEKDLMAKVELDCLLDVIQAREKGRIGKTNVLKMDKKLNHSMRKMLDKDVPLYELTLPERVKNNEKRLPKPSFEYRPLGPYKADPKDLAHW